MTRQCEECDEDYETRGSDASENFRFCSIDCEQGQQDTNYAFSTDIEWLIDNDHTMDN